MAMASDLEGLGVSGLLAARTANAGTGPFSITSAGSGFSSATRIKCTQYLVFNGDTDGTKAIALPAVGGDNGCLLGDQFVVGCETNATLPVYASTGVVISVGATLTSSTTIAAFTTMTLYPITTTLWVGVKGG